MEGELKTEKRLFFYSWFWCLLFADTAPDHDVAHCQTAAVLVRMLLLHQRMRDFSL